MTTLRLWELLFVLVAGGAVGRLLLFVVDEVRAWVRAVAAFRSDRAARRSVVPTR